MSNILSALAAKTRRIALASCVLASPAVLAGPAMAGPFEFAAAPQNDLNRVYRVDKATGTGEIQDVDWAVTLTQGTYRYVCDAHPTTMKGSFTVGTVAPTTPSVTQKVGASVGPGAKIAFARSAKAGKAVITVRDRTTKDNFHLVGPGVNKKTGVKFTGTVKWTVTLRAGTYTFRSDAHSKLHGKTTVAKS